MPDRPRAPARADLAPALALGVMVLASCGTDAVGVEACRKIETARCRAAPACPGAFGTGTPDTPEEVEACITFYRDQCLNGLGRGADPGAPVVDGCVSALDAVAACARSGQASLDACPDPSRPGATIGATRPEDAAMRPCDAIVFPERLAACAFLADAPPGGTGGTGGGGAVDDASVDGGGDGG